MLEELFNLVKNVAGEKSNADDAGPHNQEVVAEATNTVASGLRNMVAGGGVQNIVNMFSGKQGGGGLLGNPLVSMMIGHFANKLMNKYNMQPSQASSLSSSLIPSVMENLINKTNDPNEQGFSLDNLLNSITGGKSSHLAQNTESSSGGLTDLLSGFTGGQGNGGLMDIVTQLAAGAQGEQQKNGGSLLDLIKGFTGR